MVSVKTMMSFDCITFWISISPSLPPVPLMFQVTTRIGCAFFVSVTGIKPPGGLITFGVSWSISYLLTGMHCWVSLLMASANSVRPDSEKCSPSLPKCDRNRWSSLSTCILSGANVRNEDIYFLNFSVQWHVIESNRQLTEDEMPMFVVSANFTHHFVYFSDASSYVVTRDNVRTG